MQGRTVSTLLLLVAVLVAACAPGPTAAPSNEAPRPTQQAGETDGSASSQPSDGPTRSPEVTPNPIGFAFDAEAVVMYYESVGYECSEPRPSTEAVGYMLRTCQRVDPAGRTLTIGLVTDAAGALGNAFAGVQAVEGEPVLDPVDTLDPLSGFLGAMLGSDRSEGVVEWLAGHAGDAYAETSGGGLRIATYTPAEDDHTTIFVELANQAYLDAPEPSGG
jgi:hypothetical protein